MAAGLTAYNVAQTKTGTADNAAGQPTTPSVPARQAPSLSPPAPDTSEAYRLAAEKGDAKAQYNLGLLYEFGTGVSKDVVQAAQWYVKAAEQGYAEAQVRLGIFYQAYAVPPNFTEAAKWYRKAAEQNYLMGAINLGNLYLQGDGVAKDPAEVLKWWAKAPSRATARGNQIWDFHMRTGSAFRRTWLKLKTGMQNPRLKVTALQ